MFKVGEYSISAVSEMVVPLRANRFPQWRPDLADSDPNAFSQSDFDAANATFPLAIQSWIVRSPDKTIVIDTCTGNDKLRAKWPHLDNRHSPFLERLQAAGVVLEEVDYVINTHLHVDHVGWNTRLVDGQWVPTFPRATYLFPRVECENLGARLRRDGATPELMPFVDSVLPILDLGRAQLMEGNETISEAIDLMPCAGHSMGQMAVRIRAGGKEALFVADTVHIPLEIYYPDWIFNCEDPETARATRLRLLEYCARHQVLTLPSHFCPPHGGYVKGQHGTFSYIGADAGR